MRTLSGAVGGGDSDLATQQAGVAYAELRRLIDAWPRLTDDARSQIIAILDAADRQESPR